MVAFTISDLEPRCQYAAAPAQVDFSVTFEFREDSDLAVYVDDVVQVLNTDYTVTGAGVTGGGILTFAAPMSGGEEVVIFRNMPIARVTEKYATYGPLPAVVIEADFDDVTMKMQQLEREIGRSVHMSPGDTTDSGDFELPPADQRADKLLGFDSNGKPELVTPVENVGMLSVSVVGGILYPQSLHEVAAAATPVNIQDNYGVYNRYGSTGDGVTVDNSGVAAAIRVAEGSKRSVSGVAGDTYKLDAVLSPTGALLMTMFGATFKGDGTDNIITPKTRFDLFDGTFDTFLRGVDNPNDADPAIDLSVDGTEFTGAENVSVNIECPTRYFSVRFSRFYNSKVYGVRHGNNVLANQVGYKAGLTIGCLFDGLTSPAVTASIAAVISYANFGKIIANHARSVVGVDTKDKSFYYSKMIMGIVALNTGDGLTSPGTPIPTGIQLKGDNRSGAGATPFGYGALALGNNLRGSAVGNGIQHESDWQRSIANMLEGFQYGFQLGSGDIANGCILALNTTYNNGVASGASVTAGSIKGAKMIEALSVHHGAIDGLFYSTNGADLLDRVSIIGDIIEGKDATGGSAVKFVAGTAGAITRLLLSGLHLKNFLHGVVLSGCTDVALRDIRFTGITATAPIVRPYEFTTVKNVTGRNAFNFERTTTDATVTDIFDVGDMSDGDVWSFHAYANAMRSDNSALAMLRRDFVFKKTGGTVTLVASGTQVNEGGSAYVGFTAAASGNRCVIKLTGIAAQTWKAVGGVDFELSSSG